MSSWLGEEFSLRYFATQNPFVRKPALVDFAYQRPRQGNVFSRLLMTFKTLLLAYVRNEESFERGFVKSKIGIRFDFALREPTLGELPREKAFRMRR